MRAPLTDPSARFRPRRWDYAGRALNRLATWVGGGSGAGRRGDTSGRTWRLRLSGTLRKSGRNFPRPGRSFLTPSPEQTAHLRPGLLYAGGIRLGTDNDPA